MTDFEEQLSWLMAHAKEVATQDFVDFFTEHRAEFMVLHPGRKKNEANVGWFQSKAMDAEIDASPFGQRLIEWVNNLPPEDNYPPDAEMEAAFDAIATEAVKPVKAPAITPVEPAPDKPSGWEQLNFKDSPKRETRGEARKLNRWSAGKPSTGKGGWDDGSRDYLDA
jgi:hypothetical protein